MHRLARTLRSDVGALVLYAATAALMVVAALLGGWSAGWGWVLGLALVANYVADVSIGFDSDQNEVLVIGRDGGVVRIERAAKAVIANRLLDLIVQRLM